MKRISGCGKNQVSKKMWAAKNATGIKCIMSFDERGMIATFPLVGMTNFDGWKRVAPFSCFKHVERWVPPNYKNTLEYTGLGAGREGHMVCRVPKRKKERTLREF